MKSAAKPEPAGSSPGAMKPRIDRELRHLYRDPLFLALIPPVSLTFDYSMTFRLAGSHDAVLAFEASPVVRLVLEHHLQVAYYIALLALYFLASCSILKWLSRTPYYPFGVAPLLIIGTAHIMGGLSWIARSSLFSMGAGLTVTFLFLLTALMMGRKVMADRKARSGGDKPTAS